MPLAALYRRTYHRITAVYGGGAAFASSTSPGITQEVQLRSALALSTDPSPSDLNQPVTLTAQVLYSGARPSGTIEFRDGSTTLGTVSLTEATASLSVSFDAAGEHQLVAIYSGDANHLGGTSAAVIHVVNRAPTTVALASGLNPSTRKQALTFTATVAPAAATGTVQFFDGTALLGSAAVSAGRAAITLVLPVGTHPITAQYGGNTQYESSTSAVLTQIVTKN